MDDARSISLDRKLNRLKNLLNKYRASRQSHSALLKLSEHASKVSELTLLYPAIQRILKDSLFCKNFYVVLYNNDKEKLELTYFIDENDAIQSPTPELKKACLEQSLSGLVYRTNQSQLLNKNKILEYAKKSICQVIGTPCEHWLGVPIQHEGQTIGVMATQSYDIEQSFNQNQIDLFETVAFYFSTAIERVKKRQYMAQQIEKKTEQLRFEVARNKDTIRKKNMLYAISKLATTSLSNSNFYAQVHEAINEEVFAKNLFIALKSNVNDDIDFPYAIDETTSDFHPKKLNRRLTEFVIDSGKTELFDRQRILDELEGYTEQTSGIELSLLPTSWVGVPLYHRQQVIGILACQAFNEEYAYKQTDIDLISFVSEQISNVVVKHIEDNELEQRVQEKTIELQHANIHLQLQIEERKKIEQQLFHDAHHDNLTGLANRSLFISQLEKTVQRYKRDQSSGYAVLFIDLDNFKEINDNLGHYTGDNYLKLTADAFSACIRDHDLLARFGGDEFVILLTNLQMIDEAKKIAERIVTLMNKPFSIDGIQVQSGASIGIAYSNKQYNDADDIISDADSAMYIAKKSGKGTIKINKENQIANKSRLAKQSLDTLALNFSNSKVSDLNTERKFASHFKAMLEIGSGVKLELSRLVEKLNQPINYRDLLVEKVSEHLQTANALFFQLHQSALNEEFDAFFETLNPKSRNICWMMSYDSIAKLSTTQIKRLNKLKEMGFNLAVTDIARNQIDIVKLTCVPFDFYILDPNFCRRLLNELMAQSQLTALIALCQNTKAKIIATGPNIISYQTSLKKLGVPLYLNQMDEELEELQSHSIRKDNVKSKLS